MWHNKFENIARVTWSHARKVLCKGVTLNQFKQWLLLGSLSISDIFELQMASTSDLFSSLTCPLTIIFLLLSIFSRMETISLKIWERPLS